MFRSQQDAAEGQARIVRRLTAVAQRHSQVSKMAPGSPEYEQVEDAIADGEYLVKKLGGVAVRSAHPAAMRA